MIKKTAVNEYFQWLRDSISSDSQLHKVVSEYLDREQETQENDGPFLTIITRTQGKRKHMLAETLLCLQGQSNTNFELLVMAHNVDEENQVLVDEIINDVPEWFRNKIRLIPVCGGTRTTPLNTGFREAKGQYIAILDDDDIVFDNWVESFSQLAKENCGKTLHTYAIGQDWEVVGEDGIPRACGTPDSIYCNAFDFKRQMSVNACPLHSLAFPAFAYKEMGIKFDESLNTTEDWDFLMRTIFFTGVADKKEITCIYRHWDNVENSQTLHNDEEWDKNHMYIVDRLRSMPMVLTPDAYDDVFGPKGKYGKLVNAEDNEFFYDDGKGFISTCTLDCKACARNSEYLIEIPFNQEIKEVFGIRLDPMDKGGFSLDNLEVKIEFSTGNTKTYKAQDVIHNGIRLKKGEIVYLKDDPQVVIRFAHGEKINKVYAKYDIITPINDDIINRMFSFQRLFRRTAGLCLRKAKGIVRRIINVLHQ